MSLYEFETASPVNYLDPLGFARLIECLNALRKGFNAAKHLIGKHMVDGKPKPFKDERVDEKIYGREWDHVSDRKEKCASMAKALTRFLTDCGEPCDAPLPVTTRVQVEALGRMYQQFCHDTPPLEGVKKPYPYFEWNPLNDVDNEDVQDVIERWGWPKYTPPGTDSTLYAIDKTLEYTESALRIADKIKGIALGIAALLETGNTAVLNRTPALAY